ncbi:phosphate acyltransferase PlsX [Alkalimarinus sediminis]|uniref:Phosphate acyltransferase n=1 Tax=Alkalimarinus sediminis TaxID=1632866 RepID=A0A9E8HLF3_9ALTE|nr:phosphate acyltransferase PlsX [Alkalimarinus sediminis]UZW76480.1 phosphate acyltransferase PlsX [Alkalimarinus sediminis]
MSLLTTNTALVGRVTVAVDAMGGDFAPQATVIAALESLKKNEALGIILVGDQKMLEALLYLDSKKSIPQSCSNGDQPQKPTECSDISPVPPHLKTLASTFKDSGRLAIHHAPDVVLMSDRPSRALRRKQNSSMAVALQLVKDGVAGGCVSAGNTGALMLLARSILGMCPGIDRPAITKKLPAPKGGCYVLDLGANVDSTAEHLYQFSLMGSILVEAMEGIEKPRVALINVGEEEIKGSEQVRLASRMLAECEGVNYVGYIEGGDLFNDVADVVVCDGFVGNVALKTGEGVAKLLYQTLLRRFDGPWYMRLLGKLMMPVFKRFLKSIDPSRYNGALFVGLQGVVVKSHGNADAQAFEYAIEQAAEEVERKVPDMINSRLDELLF